MSDWLEPVADDANHRERVARRKASILAALTVDLHYAAMSSGKFRLLDAGARKLKELYGLVDSYEIVDSERDHTRVVTATVLKWTSCPPASAPSEQRFNRLIADDPKHHRYWRVGSSWFMQIGEDVSIESKGVYSSTVRCQVRRRGFDEVLGEAIGLCSTMEAEYVEDPRSYEHVVLQLAQIRALNKAITAALCLDEVFGDLGEASAATPTASAGASSPAQSVPPGAAAVPRSSPSGGEGGGDIPAEAPLLWGWQFPAKAWAMRSDRRWKKPASTSQHGAVTAIRNRVDVPVRGDDAVLDAAGIPAKFRQSMAACTVVITFYERLELDVELRQRFLASL